MEKKSEGLMVLSQNSTSNKPRVPPKRFIKNQIPDSITNDTALNEAIGLLPSNYNFEVHKCVWRILSSGAKRVALQFPEGLLMYSLVLSDIFKTFGKLDDCFILGDVTYGACCIDDFSAIALDAQLLIHYGHSCLVPIDSTKIPCLYVFVEIKIDVDRLIETIRLNIDTKETKKLALAGTIQFSAAIRAAKPALEDSGFEVLIPQSKPLSGGEILGCTSPTLAKGLADVVIFVADGRFHLEAFMIANPGIKAFRYDPYLGVLFLEEYAHKEMKEVRKNAILKARKATNWGIILGTLGRQGNTRILDRVQGKMREKGFAWTTILMSEISPTRIALFGESVDAWIQIACPRLSIDWGEAFTKPLLTPFEAEITLGLIPGWWERMFVQPSCKSVMNCEENSCCKKASIDAATDYPMDYYAQDGGEWNCAPSKRASRPPRRNLQTCTGQAPKCEYFVNGNEYDMGYYLFDGIYTKWATLIQSISAPRGFTEQNFVIHQEGAQKDVEKAFGVLQARWAIVRSSVRMWDKKDIGLIMRTCVILHNMIVESEHKEIVNWRPPSDEHVEAPIRIDDRLHFIEERLKMISRV